jgi:phage terminase large subunit-like protein
MKIAKIRILIELDDPQTRSNTQACAIVVSSLSKEGFLNPVILDSETVEIYER